MAIDIILFFNDEHPGAPELIKLFSMVIFPKTRQYGLNIPFIPISKVRPKVLEILVKGLKGDISLIAQVSAGGISKKYANTNQILTIIRDALNVKKESLKKSKVQKNLYENELSNDVISMERTNISQKKIFTEKESSESFGDPNELSDPQGVLVKYGIPQRQRGAPSSDQPQRQLQTFGSDNTNENLDEMEQDFMKKIGNDGKDDVLNESEIREYIGMDFFEPGSETRGIEPGMAGSKLNRRYI